ncbi:hypothetical protein CROQUDRAFT_433497 [Cronartium quercuum f. sp. fusiforme G11]|uniref:Uncharacterized protein n=1 Tax=Cronartium quercuum f. sp. fusiforme G11 TaxID=708437 RepID=A0A9P6NLY3_9BASI|nr:hypothetical protein CROQUDRAFT_433497 [Cronartium quercuum f. sp. fusiforme G11]
MSDVEAEHDDDQYSLNDEEGEYEDWTGSEAHSDDSYHFEEERHLDFYHPLDYHLDSDDEDDAEAAEAEAEVERIIDNLGPAGALIFRSARAGMSRTEILAHLEAHGFPMSPTTLDRRLRSMKLSTSHSCLTPQQCARAAPIIFQCHRLGYSRTETLQDLRGGHQIPMTDRRLREMSKAMDLN